MAAASFSPDVMNILLVGKTGSGKSSTGNSILGKKTFKASGQGESVTNAIEVSYSEIDGHQIKLIDGPGAVDTNLDELEDKIRLITNVGKALFECNGFINAVVLVLKYGDRFTKDTQSALDAVMNILGSDIMKDFGIVVLTNGNAWYQEFEGKTTFQDWCRNHGGLYTEILEKCGYRCVLFENLTRNQAEKKKQRDELVDIVVNIRRSKGTCSNAKFEFAAAERDKYIAKMRCSLLKEEYQKELSLLTGKMTSINNSMSKKEKIEDYTDVVHSAEKLLQRAKADDAGSGELAELMKDLKDTIASARLRNRETLNKLASRLEKLRKNRKRAIHASILEFLFPGIYRLYYALTCSRRQSVHDLDIAWAEEEYLHLR